MPDQAAQVAVELEVRLRQIQLQEQPIQAAVVGQEVIAQLETAAQAL
jgi:hypothetical protein